MVTIPCICPGRHASDTVELRSHLGPVDALTCRNALATLFAADPDAGIPEALAVLQVEYVLRGVVAWSLTEADGSPIPVTRAAIRQYLANLDRPEVLYAVADAADDLYRESVMLPLLRTASTSSPPGPTGASTSAPTDSTSSPPTPFSRFSTSTTQTDATATTGPRRDGASRSSRKPASAA